MNAAVPVRAAARKGRAPARRTPAPKPTVRLPVAPGRLRRWAVIGGAALLLAGGAVAATVAGVPQRAWLGVATAAAAIGFEVRHVEVTGATHTGRLPVYAAALAGPSDSMLLVDLDAIRERLRQLPWVADASVARRLPDTLAIDIVERKPVALWQFQRRLAVIDRTGAVLATDGLERFASLPIVVGPGANGQAQALMTLLAGQPRIASQVDAASWIGGRRWDLRLKTGEVVSLPEGAQAAAAALARFAALDAKTGLTGRGFARFDLRLKDKMVVRVTGEPGATAVDPKAKAGVTI